MKRVRNWAVVLFAVSLCCASGQDRPTVSQGNMEAINNILSDTQAGMSTGSAEKTLARLGDEAADTAIRGHTLEEIGKEPMAIAMAKMIALSFSYPDFIINESNKTPQDECAAALLSPGRFSRAATISCRSESLRVAARRFLSQELTAGLG